jgi:type VI secretion system secreted protein VgrG
MANGSPTFQFHSDAVPDDTFVIHQFSGREALSTPFEFEIDLLTRKKPQAIKLDDLIANPAHLSVKYSVPLKDGSQGTKTSKIQGMLSQFELVDQIREFTRYRALLVPRLWKLSLSQQCRIFQEMGVREIVEAVLTDKTSHQFQSEDYQWKANATYPKREFNVQYNESDLDFAHRWLEHEGVFFYFLESDHGEKVVFCDSPESYLPSWGQVRFKPSEGEQSADSDADVQGSWAEETIRTFHCRLNRRPAAVKLKDYNYRNPDVDIKAESQVKDSKGEGTIYEYGDHFKTPSEGERLAKARAEAIKCREKVFQGTGNVRPFRPGLVFTLSDHFHPELNREYVIVAVRHRMGRRLSEGSDLSPGVHYENEFECIASDLVFRPERKTEWPSVHGVLNAQIDAASDGKYAEIDDQGRYKVKLPFDLSDKKDGKASQYVRMMQPYAGAGMGMHFPLHKGTEVLLAFIDGDPDRPIILGAVPNPRTSGPVQGGNQSQCAIHTGGGNKMVIEDTQGKEQILITSPHSGTWTSYGAP